MMLNEKLKANSEPLSVKMRGGSMMKFDFGIYKTVSAKAGLTKTSSSSKLFSSVEKIGIQTEVLCNNNRY